MLARLRRIAVSVVVVVDDTSQHVSTVNRTALSCRGCSRLYQRDWNILVDTMVCSAKVVVLDVLQEHSPQVPLADDKQVIQALFPHSNLKTCMTR